MARRFYKYANCLIALVLATGTVVSTPMSSVAVAQSSQGQLSLAQITQAVAALLASNPNGGDQLASAIQALAVANPSPAALAAIMAAVRSNGNDAQQAAAGQGFGQAAQAAVNSGDMALATALQAAVASSGSQQAVASFAAAAGDSAIAAISNSGGGQQAGGGGSGSPTNNGPPTGGSGGGGGTGSSGGTGGTGTQQAGLTGGGGGGSGSGGTTGSVSPQ